MQVAQAVRSHDGVRGCELVMGTAANLEALRARGVECDATPADVVIAVEGPGTRSTSAERELAAAAAAADARPRSQRRRARSAPPRASSPARTSR